MKEQNGFERSKKHQNMKNIIVLAGFSLLIFASCKKDFTCECTRTDSAKILPEDSTIKTLNGIEDEVAAFCEKGDTAYGTIKITCVTTK